MAATKISDLVALTTPASVDLLAIVYDPAGTPITRKITLADLAKGFQTIVCAGQSLTGSQDTSLVSLAATWNTTGTPTAFDLNVTDTASNASSLLMNLRVGGVSRFSVAKAGSLVLKDTGNTTIFSALVGASNGEVNILAGTGHLQSLKILPRGAGYGWPLAVTCEFRLEAGSNAFSFSHPVLINGSLGLGNANDLSLFRDTANTLAQRNGVNAQAFRLYGTYTDASNYRRAALAMTTAGVVTLAAEGAGTGASGNVLHISSLPTANPGPGILWNNSGTPAIGT